MIVVAHRAHLLQGTLLETLQIGHVLEDAARLASGCVTYKLYLDPTDPNTLFIFEVWASAEARVQFQRASIAHTFSQHLARQIVAPLSSQYYNVASVIPLPAGE